VTPRRAAVNEIELDVLEAGAPDAPPVILAHGFPESSWSWRHQLPALADAGWHAIAPDQRGYGGSSRPERIEDYASDHLAADLVALLDQTGHDQGVFVGHDWGALIVWDLVRQYPERVRAVVGVSVPYPQWPGPPTVVFRHVFADHFFYILYFQAVGPAERELEADVRRTLRLTLWGASAAGATRSPALLPVEGTGFLDTMGEWPHKLPPWLGQDDFDRYVAAFEQSGFFGPLSYYRNLDANEERLRAVEPSVVTMPTAFIAGEDDLVIRDRSGVERMAQIVPGFRRAVLLSGVGHWTQQEDPAAFNAALLDFLAEV
jgi:pimeloyl-ACP methyl ester carboxylesterase